MEKTKDFTSWSVLGSLIGIILAVVLVIFSDMFTDFLQAPAEAFEKVQNKHLQMRKPRLLLQNG